MEKNPIPLVKDTISKADIDELIRWLQTNPRLTKGEKTIEFEAAWSNWLGCRHSVFVNSGSSANLAIIYALKLSGRLKNDKVIVPCLSWVTTVSPIIQFGLQPILCDASRTDLGMDVDRLEKLVDEHDPAVIMIVHALGFPNDMDRILRLCNDRGILLVEDSCESVGSLHRSKKTGTFGFASSFSTYYGHHFSTIEGGFVCTNDYEFHNIVKSIRSHGWSRDLDEVARRKLQMEYGVDDFRNLYTFYHPGFNLRSTDLQAVIGLGQLERLDASCDRRWNNLLEYDARISNGFWKILVNPKKMVSNFAYPIIHPSVAIIKDRLAEESIECRPLVCGSISRQPFFYERYGHQKFEFADVVHDYGMYLPNNPDMTVDDISRIAGIVNSVTVR